jgi:cytochrome P450
MAAPIEPSAVPSHIPPELVVREFPFSFGATTTEIPFDRMVSQVHASTPELFYVPELAAGGVGGWIPRRQEDMRAIYMDYEHFSNQNTTPFPELTGGSWRVLPLESDPPLHSAYRSFLNPVFAPKVMGKLDEKIRDYARGYVLGFRDKGRIDFLQEFAFEFPIKVFLELMGLPQERVKTFLDWTGELLHAPDVETLLRATDEVIAYLETVIADRKVNPRDDIVSYGVQATVDGGRALTHDELLGFCFNLFVGGLDTVSTNLTWQFLHLARNPDHQTALRDNPKMIPDAIDEFMRAFAAVMTFRVCVKETSVRGVTIKPGDKVAMSTTLAARDPAEWDRPDEIILDRKPRHVSFGYGPHLCVGMHLAKREMRIAIEEFLLNIPPFRLSPSVEMRTALHGVMQPDRLVLEWER